MRLLRYARNDIKENFYEAVNLNINIDSKSYLLTASITVAYNPMNPQSIGEYCRFGRAEKRQVTKIKLIFLIFFYTICRHLNQKKLFLC